LERKASNGADLRQATPPLSAPFQRAGKKVENAAEPPPNLAQVAVAWQHMPEAINAGIVAWLPRKNFSPDVLCFWAVRPGGAAQFRMKLLTNHAEFPSKLLARRTSSSELLCFEIVRHD
jgi:hypothetical protein